jgi:TPR repeat protein
MADVAHEASGPASPKPGDVASQQASRPDSPDKGKLRVFISYSRHDNLYFADQLYAALNACGFECFIDRHGISGGEEWKPRLGNLITGADTVVFVLSPASAGSKICDWEVEEADRLGKRILPVISQPLEGASPPPRLRERNYIFFYDDREAAPDSGFGTGLAKLIAALNTNLDWLREHTRYLQHAIEWDRGGRPANRLLSGNDIAEAEAWAARRPKNAPELTALHLDFIRASEEEAEARLSTQRKQLEAMAAAQAERETALRQAEEAQRKRAMMARIRNIALLAVSILALLAVVLAWLAEQQRMAAKEQSEQVDHMLVTATDFIVELAPQMNDNAKKQAFAVFKTGADRGNARSMFNLGQLYSMAQDYANAREWYAKAADKGHPTATLFLGTLYARGEGVPQDIAKARELYEKAADMYEKAADKGKPITMLFLGGLYAQGQVVAQDYAKAREWWEKAADKGNADAMVNLGLLYVNGHGVTQDYAKAREWYEKAADKGDASGMVGLGVLYHNGWGVAQDHAKAREWYEKAADKGDASGMVDLGVLYHNGWGVAQDHAKARDWYEKAADKGDASAMSNLGKIYQNGLAVAQDYAKAREWYAKAADKDDASGMVGLGWLYSNGWGVAEDHHKAREWFKRAADKGDASGMVGLGVLYENGFSVAQDYAKAREWFEKAADKGDAIAMNSLGWLYQNGLGVDVDYAKAREWYEKAADKGNADAMVNLGLLYVNGFGVAQDYAKAREWWEKAADKGNAEAMNYLGLLYVNGHGVTQDYAKAREWYEKAADKGNAEAKAQLEQLPVREAAAAGRYAEALQLQERLALKVEEVETKREGKPSEETAQALEVVAWYALFAREFTKALTVADRAHALLPDDLGIETRRAHALMFVDYREECKALYLAHRGKAMSGQDERLWERAIAEDFAEFRKAGLTHPMMAEIEKELGVSP